MDFQNPEKNIYFAINQFTVAEHNQNKRPDVILFINGLPLVVMELKNPADQQATIRKAYDQIQTYKTMIPSLFFYNAFCVISDGWKPKRARYPPLTAAFRVGRSNRKAGDKTETQTSQLETLVKGYAEQGYTAGLDTQFHCL